MKICRLCKVNREYSEYDKSKKHKDGLRSECKICRAAERQTSGYKAKHAAYNKKYYDNGYKQYHKEFYQENKEQIIADVVKRTAERLASDPHFKLKHALRGQVRDFLDARNSSKNSKTFTILGYTSKQFRDHFSAALESFEGNRISLDHKIPISWFEEGTPLNIIFHLENLQVMEHAENNSKLNRFMHPVSKEFHCVALPYIKQKFLDKMKSPT